MLNDVFFLVGPPNADSRMLFAKSYGQSEAIWSVLLPSLKWQVLYRRPPVRYPPRLQRQMKRHGPIAYAKAAGWGELLPSPSGKLLLFESYLPDNYLPEALWLLNLATRRASLVAWDDAESFHLFPLRWAHDDTAFFFLRVTMDGTRYYRLELDKHLLDTSQVP